MSLKEKNLVDIDLNQLHIEWAQQARLYRIHAVIAAKMRKAVLEAKANMEFVEAKLKLRIRADPKAYDLPKVTDDTVKDAVKIQPRYRRAYQEWVDARFELEKKEALVTALDHRKKALENEVDLRLASYFAEPRDRTKGQEMREAEKARIRGLGHKKR